MDSLHRKNTNILLGTAAANNSLARIKLRMFECMGPHLERNSPLPQKKREREHRSIDQSRPLPPSPRVVLCHVYALEFATYSHWANGEAPTAKRTIYAEPQPFS
jgi:hypothetical protein